MSAPVGSGWGAEHAELTDDEYLAQVGSKEARKAGGQGGASAYLSSKIVPSADEATTVQDALRAALRENSVKVMDLFIEWDTDGDHTVSKAEFRKAMAALGFNHPRLHVDAVFESFDLDGSGSIDYKELNKSLK